jgi:ribosomal protein L11 methyltransferase
LPRKPGKAVASGAEPASALLRSRRRPASHRSEDGAWLELSVEADLEAVEAVSEILARVAPGGTSVEPGFELVDEGLVARIDPGRPAIVRAYIPAADPGTAERLAEDVARDLGHLSAFGLRPIGPLKTRAVAVADWAEAWKAHFPVMRIGRRFVVRPSWRRHKANGDEIVLALDPGMAFGTGLHPTTRLCLAGLEALGDAGALDVDRTLDVGCGSGILSIAAARLGARAVTALDIDPIAVDATAANARRNGLGGRIRPRLGSLPSGDDPYDLVVANLIATSLIALAGDLAGEVEPRGRWLVSGIFVDREAAVREAFTTAGLTITDRWAEDEWVALAGTRL